MGLKKLKTDTKLKFNEKLVVTGFDLTLASGNEVIYIPDDISDSYFYGTAINSSDLDYNSLSICSDFLEVAVNADDEDFETAVSDIREIRKAHHNLKIKLGLI